MDGVAVQVDIPTGVQYQVIPSFVDNKYSSSIFCVQLIQNEEILDLIQEFCNEQNQDLVAVAPEKLLPRSICIAKYGGSTYYRGFIEAVDKEQGKATITFFDYGNTENIPVEDIANVPGMVRTFVPQAYRCEWQRSTKQGLKKLYALQCDEVEVAIEIVGKRYDEVMRATIYTVNIPSLEHKAEKPGNKDIAGANVSQEAKAEVSSTTNTDCTDFAPPLPSVPPPVNAAPSAGPTPEFVERAQQFFTALGAGPIGMTPKEEFKMKASANQGNATAAGDFGSGPGMAKAEKVGSYAPPRKDDRTRFERNVFTKPAPVPRGGSKTVKTDTGTMAMKHDEQAENGQPSTGATALVQETHAHATKYNECAESLQKNPEFFHHVCNMYASFAWILEHAVKK